MTKEFNPKVSIVIPVYNGSNYVKEAIDSALAQTYKNIEIIVVNDGSRDDGKTDKICRSYGDKIRYFPKENGGVASALNMGIEKMKGEYFSWLSHDDVYYPDKVKSQIALLSKLNDKKTIIYSGLDIIDSNGKHIEYQDYSKQYTKDELNRSLFPFFHLALNGCAMLIQKELFQNHGAFDIKLPTTQDYDLWFRLLRKSKIQYDRNILMKSRSHLEQGSKLLLDTHVEECNEFWLKVFSSITEKEILETGGSKINFFSDVYRTFKSLTLYNEAIDYLYSRMVEEYLSEVHVAKNKQERDLLLKSIITEIYGEGQELIKGIDEILSYGKKKKPRIVFFTGNWYDRGGLNRVISRVSSLLSSKYEVFVVCLKEIGNENGYKLDSKVKFLELDVSVFTKLPLVLKLLDTNVFVSSNNCYIPLVSMYEDIEKLNIRVVMWNHENFFAPHYTDSIQEIALVRQQIFQKVSVILWLTKFSARMGKMFSDSVGIMKNPLSFSLGLGPRNKKEKNRFNIASLARFDSAQKRLNYLITVFAKVIKKIPEAKLYVIGGYDLNMRVNGYNGETIQELIDRLKIPKGNLVFTGEVKDVKKYYPKMRVNVMTSEREGFGLTVLESALFGIPSVVFGGGGMGDIITDGENGFVIDDDNIEKMAEKIILLIQDDEVYKRMSESAYSLVNEYGDDIVKNNWIKLLDGVINLPKNELPIFMKDNFLPTEKVISKQDFKDVVVLYEEAVKNKIRENKQIEMDLNELNVLKEQLSKMENSISWRMTKPFRKMRRLIELLREQGIVITIRNIFLKVKEKIFKRGE